MKKFKSAALYRYFFILLIFCTGMSLSFAMYHVVSKWEFKRIEADFVIKANDRVQVIEDGLSDDIDALEYIADFYEASQEVERSEFFEFTKNIFKRHPDILDFAWIPRLSDSQRVGFEESLNLEGYKDFQITELNSKGELVKAPHREQYFPICYIEPFEKNKAIFGFNVFSDPKRKQAMEKARDSGSAVMTEVFRLIRKTERGLACRVFIPIYKKNTVLMTVEQRRKNLIGFISLRFRADVTINTALGKLAFSDIFISIYDETIPGEKIIIYPDVVYQQEHPIFLEKKQISNDFVFERTFDVAGRKWSITCKPLKGFFSEYKYLQSLNLLVSGIIITFVLTIYLINNFLRTKRIESLVKQRTAALQVSEAKYRELVENANSIILKMDKDGNVTFFNEFAQTFFGFSSSEILGKNVVGTIVPETESSGRDLSQMIKNIARYPDRYTKNENENIDKNGKLSWISWTNKAILDAHGNVIEVFCVGSDITKRKLAEEKARLAAEEWEKTFNAMSDMIFIQDNNNIILKANEAFAKAVHSSPKDIIGKKCHIIIHGIGEPIEQCPFEKTKKDQMSHTEEVFEPRINLPLLVTTSPIFNNQGQMVGSVHIAKDMTEFKKAEQKIQEALKIKSGFISTVSHELRTPLSAMKEAINLVIDGSAGPLSKEQEELLDIAKRNVDRLARLINDVLDFQKLESGKMTFNMQKNDINEITKETKKTMQSLAQNKGIEIILQLSQSLPLLKFDKDKIIQVLSNIVNNAIKFTEKGSITIATKQVDDYVTVSVKDTGSGIKKEDIAKLFQKFTQLEKGLARKTGGTGLGLAISKEIIERHKGKIWVESEYGEGSVFYFTIPINSGELNA